MGTSIDNNDKKKTVASDFKLFGMSLMDLLVLNTTILIFIFIFVFLFIGFLIKNCLQTDSEKDCTFNILIANNK